MACIQKTGLGTVGRNISKILFLPTVALGTFSYLGQCKSSKLVPKCHSKSVLMSSYDFNEVFLGIGKCCGERTFGVNGNKRT